MLITSWWRKPRVFFRCWVIEILFLIVLFLDPVFSLFIIHCMPCLDLLCLKLGCMTMASHRCFLNIPNRFVSPYLPALSSSSSGGVVDLRCRVWEEGKGTIGTDAMPVVAVAMGSVAIEFESRVHPCGRVVFAPLLVSYLCRCPTFTTGIAHCSLCTQWFKHTEYSISLDYGEKIPSIVIPVEERVTTVLERRDELWFNAAQIRPRGWGPGFCNRRPRARTWAERELDGEIAKWMDC